MDEKRKFVVDYRENGVYKHQLLNVDHTGNMTDKEIVRMCHMAVGSYTVLDGVIEVFTSMSAEELEQISSFEECERLNMRPLYMNMDEVKKMRAMMGLTV